jgi:hypothetical protein
METPSISAQHAIEAAASHHGIVLTEQTQYSLLELSPLPPIYPPLRRYKQAYLLRIWAACIEEYTCYVAQSLINGRIVYLAS